MRTLLFACMLMATPAVAAAQSTELPQVARAGLDAFTAAGADSAIAVWLDGASFDSPATRATLAQGFARLGEQAGRMVGYDVVRVVPVGTHVRRAYVVLHYEGSPAYLFLEMYRGPAGWGTLTVQFNGNPEAVFPPALLGA